MIEIDFERIIQISGFSKNISNEIDSNVLKLIKVFCIFERLLNNYDDSTIH